MSIVVSSKYSCSFAAYLVAQGIYGYKGGDYWGEVRRVTGLSQTHTWRWGRLFLQILQDLQLPTFPDMPGHPYVAVILAHGGIPDYCLADFFERVLQRAVTRPEYADITAAELAADLRWSSSVHYAVDKPVLRFLEYGGEVAEDFFQRCREMAWAYLEADMVPSAEQIGLPRRVVENYELWVIEQQDKVRRSAVSKDRMRLRRPEIVLDPWGQGMALVLRRQRVPASFSEVNISWLLKTDHAAFRVPVRVTRSGGDLETTSESVLLDRPSSLYEVSFQVDGEPKRTWHYVGPSHDYPLMVFHPESGTMLAPKRSLPARVLWLVFPEDLEPKFEGEADCLEKLPRLPGIWAENQSQCWDLTHTSRLTLLRAGDRVLSVAVRPDETALRPHYVGGQPFMSGQSDSSIIPSYIASPPSIRIPRTGRRELEEGLVRWRLAIRNDGPGHPQIDRKVILAELRPYMGVDERYVDLPLGVAGLLDRHAVGTFSVRLRGPMGRRANLPLRILPPIEVAGHERLYLPDPDGGPRPATLWVRVGGTTMVECPADNDSASVVRVDAEPGKGCTYVVEVAPDATRAELAIVTRTSSQQSVRVPLSVPVRRLRWALVGEREGVATEWTAQVINRPLAALLQASAPSLLIDLPLPEDTNDLRPHLHLLDIEGVELQSQEAKPPRTGQRIFRFGLGAYLDTVRASRSAVLRFELHGLAHLQEGGVDCLPVLSLTQQLVVQDIQVASRAVDNRMLVELQWSEPIQLSHRRVRFWPLHRLWERPYEEAIPDDAQGKLSLQVTAVRLPPGEYRLEFLIVDPWTPPTSPRRPIIDTPSTAEVELLGPTDWLEQIDKAVEEAGERFDLLLERALILRDAGDLEAAQCDLDWCSAHLNAGTIPQVLALADSLHDEAHTDFLAHLQVIMFAPDRIKELVDTLERGQVSTRQLQAYLAYLPEFDALPTATFVALLQVHDTALRLRAARELVARSATEGIDAVLEWVGQGSLRDDDALELLRANLEFACNHLEREAADPIAHRLLVQLSEDALGIVYVVRAGMWIYSEVGWGRIDRIEDPSSGTEIDAFIKSRLNYRLHVTLRPDGDAEPAVIDLPARIITLPKAEKISTCTKCDRFSTAKCNWEVIVNQHDRAVHGGIGPRLKHQTETTKTLQEWRFSDIPPRNQFA